jgi:predicted permease
MYRIDREFSPGNRSPKQWIESVWSDIGFAVRILCKSPGFTAIAVGSLALAIGANTTIFSFANQLLFVRLQVPHPEQIRLFRLTAERHMAIHGFISGDGYPSDDGRLHFGPMPYPAYRQLRQQNRVIEDLIAFNEIPDVDISAAGPPEIGKVEVVSGNFYDQMQVKPQLGRLIGSSDDAALGSGAVAVISNSFWHREFGGARDVLGKSIRVNLATVTIVGVNPSGFRGPVDADASAPEVFMPLSMVRALVPVPDAKNPFLKPDVASVEVMARVKPGISTATAQAALDKAFDTALRATATINKGDTIPRLTLEDGSRGITTFLRTQMRPLYILLGLAGLVLLLACANIASLMLARASTRQREMSVRIALGARRQRILRQVLTESLLLSAIGGLAGLVLGFVSRNLIPLLLHTGWDGGELPIGFDWRVFGFTCVVTIGSAVLSGVVPAWRSTRVEINAALKEGGQTASRRRKAWSGKAIVAFQISLSTLLVINATFFLRTLFNLNAVDPGFRTQNLLLIDATPPRVAPSVLQSSTLHSRLADTFEAIPGIEAVTYVNHPIGVNSPWLGQFQVEGTQQNSPDGLKFSPVAMVGPNFFSVMSIPILMGRGFSPQDTATSAPVAIINQRLAREFFPNTNPIGKRFFRGLGDKEGRWIEIIGVCADFHYGDMRDELSPVHFDLDVQSPASGSMTYVVQSRLPQADLIRALQRAAQQVDANLALNHVRTQQQQINASMQQERMFASLTAGFGILALALACVGIYGIMAYSVAQRTNEIGIRLALGAARTQIRTMVMRETGWLSIAGIISGIGVSVFLIRLVKSMLYGLRPSDPISFGVSVLFLMSMALIAGWIPATRASGVDPMEALRRE